MGRVRYWWSEDGVMEVYDRKNSTLQGPAVHCSHCDGLIHPGEDITVLSSAEGKSIMHRSCADDSCQAI